MSDYKVNVPPLVDGGAAGSAGPSMDGAATTLIPVPSTEELALLNRLQPEVQRRNNWLEDRVAALRAENERLREALKAETARCAEVCIDAAKRYEDARRVCLSPGLDVAACALQNAADEILKGAA